MSKQKEIVIDAFKAGDYPQGKFGPKELAEIQASYNPETYEAPILIGHLSDSNYKGKSTIPAFGWIGKILHIGDHLKLVASEFSEQLKELIKKGFYKKVSAAFFQPNDPNNPTPGKWHLHHVAFLGGAPPAVKGLEGIAFTELLGTAVEFAEMDVEIEDKMVDEVEGMGTADTLKDMAEYCANYLKKIEMALTSDVDGDTQRQRCELAAYDLQSELIECQKTHFKFIQKLEGIEEKTEVELTEKKGLLVEMAGLFKSFIHQRKESDMDQQKEQEYQQKIAGLEARVTEFTEKEQKTAVERQKAEQEAKDTAIATEVKTFCEEKFKANLMTPAMREKEEPIMVTLGKTNPEALKAFQEKYTVKVVPLGETDLGADLKPKNIIVKAEEYVKAHPAEFAGLTHNQAISSALNRNASTEIKL